MNIVVCIATYNTNRLPSLMYDLLHSPADYKTILILTGNDLSPVERQAKWMSIEPIVHKVKDMKRMYASIMYLKMKYCKKVCNDESVVFMLDDDMALNSYALGFARQLFEENPEVDYMSLLRGPGMVEQDLVELSGYPFKRMDSCMGNSIIVRWKTAYPIMKEFFKEYNVTEDIAGDAGQFDQPYWSFLKKKGILKPVYTLVPFSLVQHCNLTSHYLETKAFPTDHMAGVAYDPRINVEEWLRVKKGEMI